MRVYTSRSKVSVVNPEKRCQPKNDSPVRSLVRALGKKRGQKNSRPSQMAHCIAVTLTERFFHISNDAGPFPDNLPNSPHPKTHEWRSWHWSLEFLRDAKNFQEPNRT